MWERWNSIREDGMGDVRMNSFNHYAFGAIADGCTAMLRASILWKKPRLPENGIGTPPQQLLRSRQGSAGDALWYCKQPVAA